MAEASFSVEGLLGPRGHMSRGLPGFEFRPSQLQMALTIEDALRRRTPAIVEAGTGTGKTYGYLAPLILSGKQAVISTRTKNLQEQIFFKDLPRVAECIGRPAQALMMKGRKNYLCLRRFGELFSQASLLDPLLARARGRLEGWIPQTAFADRAELDWLADEDPLWDALSASSEQCRGTGCPSFDDCFYNRLRGEAARSRLIIVNHHLFFADLKVKQGGFGEIIPRFQVAVFDEAHAVEEVATDYLGTSLSTAQFGSLAEDLEKETAGRLGAEEGKLRQELIALRSAAERCIRLFDGRPDRGRLEAQSLEQIALGPGREAGRALRSIAGIAGTWDRSISSAPWFAQRSEELRLVLAEILSGQRAGFLHWYERRRHSLVLHLSPLNIAAPLRELLYGKLESVIFTSATLSTSGTFGYLRARLGLPEDAAEGIFPSHFDYRRQTLLYIPRDLPTPGRPDFGERIAQRILALVQATEGRAMVLFTSHQNLNLVHRLLEKGFPFTLLKQGDAPRSTLLRQFQQDIHSVLLATGSFWQGVDVPGESLSGLIIDKLPFDPPGEPLVAARIEEIREQGGNPFLEYQVPAAVIALKQGLGRLIRSASDRGVLAILDSRILTSRYGRFFRESLPPVPITHELQDVKAFFLPRRRTP